MAVNREDNKNVGKEHEPKTLSAERLQKSHLRSERFRGFFERVDGRLVPFFGADLGPYEEMPGTPSNDECPICGRAMTEHVIDRASGNPLLFCPAHEEHPPLEDEGPLNDLGMTKSPEVIEKKQQKEQQKHQQKLLKHEQKKHEDTESEASRVD